MRIVKLEVSGLFGSVDHKVDIRPTGPTIITGPNGAGKTHLLSLLRGLLALEVRVLLFTHYSEIRITLADGRRLTASRSLNEDGEVAVNLSVERDGKKVGRPLVLNRDILEALSPDLPGHVRKTGPDRWFDSRSNRFIPRAVVERRYGALFDRLPAEVRDMSPEVMNICSPPEPVFIDTKRLDVAGLEGSDSEYAGVYGADRPSAVSRIGEYTAQLRSEVTEARRSSIQATQSADLSFAARALQAAQETVKEDDLHKRYDQTVERYETLARNSLAVGDAPLEFPSKTTPTVRRILHVFLSDWDKRLEPLMPLNEKIQTLREILDSKLAPSRKKTAMSSRGDLEFRTFAGKRIRVADLSSGEQHLVALFTLLLFSASPRSLVLIDEPEISLHAAWKHAFLADITRVAEISNLQVIMATHSAGIINGRWDLTEELSFEMTAGQVGSGEDDEELDEFDE